MERESEERRAELEERYLNDDTEGTLFAAFYRPVMENANEYDDLFPEEIWLEAKMQLAHIRSVKRQELVLSNLRKRLEQRYSVFEDGTRKETRSPEQRKRTASIVMMAMFFQLLCRNTESLEENPYYNLILALFEDMKSDPYILRLYEAIDAEETKNEKAGAFVVQKDYLNDEKVEKILSNPLVSDDEKRITILREGYKQIKEKMKDSFTGGTQWWYVYKMMTEQKIYEDHRYKRFKDDLIAADVKKEHLPDTNLFTGKYDDIKKGTEYPNWKVAPGGREDILEMGKQFARIVFQIMHPIG